MGLFWLLVLVPLFRYSVVVRTRNILKGATIMTKKICDIQELSSYLKISVSEIRKLVRSKRIPHFRIGNRLKFDLVKINSWVEDLEAQEGKNLLFF
jgi:excisionase family DNA binding protein